MTSNLWLAGIVCLAASPALAQTAVTGALTDAETREPLVGATVIVEGTTTGTLTDLDGRYRLEVPADARALCFSYAGYGAPTCVPYDGGATLDLALRAGVDLDEVVVTALGLERQNAQLGYSIESVDAREMSDVAATNLLDNLSGQVAGVNVLTGPTGVGSTSLVSIRGEASFAGNTPLYVVDGIPVDNRSVINVTDEASQGFQEVDFGGGTPEVSPFDVASVSILKGPAAAALYGTRAANGVIIINTKSGAAPGDLGVEVNSQTTLDRPFRLPRFQNEYGQGSGGAFAYVDGAGGGTEDGITFSYGPRLDAGLLTTQFDSPVTLGDGSVVRAGDLALYTDEAVAATPFVSRPDNVRDFYETGVTTHNNVAIAQGFAGGDYRLSFTDLRSDSYIPGVNLERNNLAARLRFAPVERLEVSAGITYVNTRSDNRPASGYGSENVNYSTVAWLGRSTDIEPLRDYWQPGLEGVQQFSFNTRFFDNPFFIVGENRNSFTRDRLFGFVQARVRLTPKLDLRLRTGLDRSDEARELRRAYSTNRFRQGAYAEHDLDFAERNTDALLTYADEGGDFEWSVSAGGNRLVQTAENEQTQAEALTVPGVYRLTNNAIPLVRFGRRAERRINSVYGLARVGWRGRLFVDVTARQDYSSSLATAESSAGAGFFYPSASASWVASKSLRLPAAVSFLQLRASVAEVGNDTDPYRTAGTFVPSTPVGGAPTFTDRLELPASGLRPERARAYEVGANVRLLDDRFGLDVTAYSQTNSDQILALPTPISSGYESRVVNGGTVRATGLEVTGLVRALRLGPVRWDARVNFTRAYAEVLELPDGVARTTLAYARVYASPGQTVYYIAEPGGRIGDMYGTGYLRDASGRYVVQPELLPDGSVNEEAGEFIADNTLRRLGNYTPDFQVGFGNTLRYRGLSLDFLVDWRQGGELVSRTQALAGYSGQLDDTSFRPEGGIVVPGVFNAGTAEAPDLRENVTPISPQTYYVQYYNREHEEHNTLDATFVKLREVRLGYAFDFQALEWLEGLSVAVIGRNLAAITAARHIDPEQFAVQGQRFVRGVEDMSYPTPRSLGVSINANF